MRSRFLGFLYIKTKGTLSGGHGSVKRLAGGGGLLLATFVPRNQRPHAHLAVLAWCGALTPVGILPPVSRAPASYKRTLYKGGEGMWSWILHRGSGLAVLGFLFLHILDTSLVGLGEEHYNRFVSIYKMSFFRPLEILLIFFVIYHSFNGLRVILIDFWSKGARYEKQLAALQTVITIALFLPAAYFMGKPIFS